MPTRWINRLIASDEPIVGDRARCSVRERSGTVAQLVAENRRLRARDEKREAEVATLRDSESWAKRCAAENGNRANWLDARVDEFERRCAGLQRMAFGLMVVAALASCAAAIAVAGLTGA